MKRIFTLFTLLVSIVVLFSCTKQQEPQQVEFESVYSTLEEFNSGLDSIAALVELNKVIAYQDTLENGAPDLEGKTFPLIDFVSQIKQKIEEGNVEDAVNDVFHFDGTPYSLISYLMKAYLAKNISMEVMTQALALVHLPPIQIAGFVAPKKPKLAPPPPPQQCNCDPKIKILITYSYYTPCGNRSDTLKGYAANNTLNNMRTQTMYRFDAEIEGCKCGGTTVSTVTAPVGGRYGFIPRGTSATLFSESSGTYTVIFTYTCGCGCGKTAKETFTINFR